MQPETALVVGAGSGIGAALVDVLAGRGARVFAIARRAVSSTAPNVRWLQADVTDAYALQAAIDKLPERLNLLLVTVGTLHDSGIAPEKAFRDFDPRVVACMYGLNAVAPLEVLRRCLPRLTHPERSVALVLSAQVGSISDNRVGGWYAYRMAKAALNMGLKTVAIELARTRDAPIVAAVHPGTTATPLSAPYIRRRRAGVATAMETAQRLLLLSETLEARHSGQFLKWDGSEIGW